MITKTCTVSGQEFVVTDEDLKIYERFGVPAPDRCPNEVLRSIMAHRNERTLHHRKCDFTGKSFISAYPERTPFPVYNNESWWGDAWDPMDYGRDIDFEKPFFEQFKLLQEVVPREGTSVFNSENCEFNSHVRESKNGYLNSMSFLCEDFYYTYWTVKVKDIVDCSFMESCTLCYDCFNLDGCYECVRVQDSENCTNCYFSYGLKNCKNCIGCSNLNYKEYHIFNKPVSKEEFESTKSKILNGQYSTYQQGLKFFNKTTGECIHKNLQNLQSENVVGDYVVKSKNIQNCFDVRNSEDCAHCMSLSSAKDAYHCVSCGWPNGELVYMSGVSRGCTNLRFCYYSWFSQNLDYCDSCSSCKDCFGCISLKQKQYCIFNKQYTEAEYKDLVPKIIDHMKKNGEWGEFFPSNLTTIPYNETIAQEYYPLDQSEIETKNWKYKTPQDSVQYDGPKTIIPTDIKDVDKSICEQILTCTETGKHYRIVKPEFEFYCKMNLPIPRVCPDQRHLNRVKLRNPRELFDRNCAECDKNIRTTFAPNRPEKVLCEDCYLAVVV